MKRFPLVIADDEPLARERLHHFLKDVETWEVVASLDNGPALLEYLQHHEVALVLLDIRMPGLSGFEALTAIPPKQRPEVIFVSAYDSFAVKAFAINAVDYMLKPFERSRLELALTKALARLQDPQHLAKQISALTSGLQEGPQGRLAVREQGKISLVTMAEICWIAAAGNYLQMNCGAKTLLLRQSLTQIQKELDPNHFLRIHRSHIVNIRCISEWHCDDRQDGFLVLKDGTRLNIGRRFRADLVQKLITPEKGKKVQLPLLTKDER